jgi:hypothetical protein
MLIQSSFGRFSKDYNANLPITTLKPHPHNYNLQAWRVTSTWPAPIVCFKASRSMIIDSVLGVWFATSHPEQVS